MNPNASSGGDSWASIAGTLGGLGAAAYALGHPQGWLAAGYNYVIAKPEMHNDLARGAIVGLVAGVLAFVGAAVAEGNADRWKRREALEQAQKLRQDAEQQQQRGPRGVTSAELVALMSRPRQ